jgi:hypothetical protein
MGKSAKTDTNCTNWHGFGAANRGAGTASGKWASSGLWNFYSRNETKAKRSDAKRGARVFGDGGNEKKNWLKDVCAREQGH